LGAGSLPSASWPSVGAGGDVRVHSSITCRSRKGAGRVTMIQPRTPRTGTSCASERTPPRPRPRGYHHGGLDAAVVAEDAGHVAAAAQQLAHGTPWIRRRGARPSAARPRGGAGIDARALVLTQPARRR
jgi:hypothetical protein